MGIEPRIVPAWGNSSLQLNKGDTSDTGSSVSVTFLVFGAPDEVTAINAAYSEAPDDYSGIPKSSAEISERLTEDAWKVEISYGYTSSTSSKTTGEDISVSFDCGGGTRHIAMAISQKCLWKKEGVTFRDAKKMIGWNGKTGSDSVISGVDVPFAQPRETYTKTMEVPLSTSKRRTIASLVGCVNASKWKGWNRGEVMFLGCSYSGTENEKAQVSFNFAIQMNEEGIEIAEGVPPIKKEGHVYIWTQHETVTQNDAPVADVIAVYAAQVAKYADFSQLGLGK